MNHPIDMSSTAAQRQRLLSRAAYQLDIPRPQLPADLPPEVKDRLLHDAARSAWGYTDTAQTPTDQKD